MRHPHADQEAIIKSACPVLTPTGCTPQFCASGRMIRPQEPRVGENRSITVIKLEAEAFLSEMLDEGLLTCEKFDQRLSSVLEEIDSGAVETTVWKDQTAEDGSLEMVKVDGISSKGWVQTREELEWGVRVAWRNSRKCIMRAHFQDLKLVDLRHVSTSRGMLDALIEHAPAAYNGGRIMPTVFMFPSRTVKQMGPMFWSQSLVSYARYELPDGKTLGDPARVQLTKEIMGLGWTPPEPKTRWDVLPLVAMAEGDSPEFTVLPAEVTEPICIRHPLYPGFEDIDLKWIRFPALSNLGFDIGGVQYTASPFMGWFVDAEIGVRNLADSFRYDALPDVAKVIGWNGRDLYEKLVWLSRAQAELNFAVHSSFLKAGVTCSSTLAVSQSWCAFDDQHLKEKGYRLNADPYWIAPPQGSIVPVWHRGGAPNYQPKPMLARHRFDPVKVWKRKNGTAADALEVGHSHPVEQATDLTSTPRVHVFFSGTGGTALKLSERLLKYLKTNFPLAIGDFGPLNGIDPKNIRASDTLLLIVGTTGKGEVPSNGLKFMTRAINSGFILSSVQYTVFGLGDSSYTDTFNRAAILVDEGLREIGLAPLLATGVVPSDVAVEDPPLTSFQDWRHRVDRVLDGEMEAENVDSEVSVYIQHYKMLRSFKEASISFDTRNHKSEMILKVKLEIPEPEFQDMGHIRLLPRNSSKMVRRVMEILGVPDPTILIDLSSGHSGDSLQSFVKDKRFRRVSVHNWLTDFVDLRSPFRSMDWCEKNTEIDNSSVVQVLEAFSADRKLFQSEDLRRQVFFSMPVLRARNYSVASSTLEGNLYPNKSVLDILVHITPEGRLSDHCLREIGDGGVILYKLAENKACRVLLNTDKPIVAVACGTGIGPVRSLLRRRMKMSDDSTLDTLAPERISLFLGFKADNNNGIFVELVDEARKNNLLEVCHVVPSNEEQRRVQEKFESCEDLLKEKVADQKGYVYVCGKEPMVREVKEKLQKILGVKASEEMEDRFIQETFWV